MSPPAPSFSFSSGRPIPDAAAGGFIMPSNTANASATALSASIPPAPVPPNRNFDPIVPQQNLQYLSYQIPVGGTIHQQIAGNYYYVDSIVTAAGPIVTTLQLSNAPIYIKTSTSALLTPINAIQLGVQYPTDFEWIEISNPTLGLVVTINLWIGHGYVEDNRVRVVQIAPVGSYSSATFIRPNNATAYAANQVISTAAGGYMTFSGVSRSFSGQTVINKVVCITSSNNLVNANFGLILTNQFNTAAPVDQAAYNMLLTDMTGSEAIMQFPTFLTGGAGSNMKISEIAGLNINIQTNSSSYDISGLLFSNAAYTPTALESFKVILYCSQD